MNPISIPKFPPKMVHDVYSMLAFFGYQDERE
jgi:hypothetical protein